MSTNFASHLKIKSYIKRKDLLYKIVFIFSFFILNGCVVSRDENSVHKTETMILKNFNKGRIKTFAVSLNFPQKSKGPLPIIISQHGSNRDGMIFQGGEGRTDVFSTRLIKKGTEMGFAVVAIDAFFDTSLEPNDKGKFPNAIKYALQLKETLSKDKRFQSKNIFYTGFSYGAAHVLKSFDARLDYKENYWRAIAAVEPGCNIVSNPVNVPFSTLMIKGSESHYYIEPCEFYLELLKKKGNKISLKVVKGANHFFSSNGEIIDGIAVNGCRYNPVVRMPDGIFFFADGTPATRRTIRKKCVTYEGGSGKDRMYLDYVIATVLNFFKKSII